MTTLARYHNFNAIRDITDREFQFFQQLIYQLAGISLSEAKKPMVASRLQSRLVHHGLHRYQDYYDKVMTEPDELQKVIDHLTTNETYFFREPEHFKFLSTDILPKCNAQPVRLWSAACSSGEEAYTLAMVVAEQYDRRPWEILGTDINQTVLKQAARGHYPLLRNGGVSQHLLKKYCLKGTGAQADTFLIDHELKSRVKFSLLNLKKPLPAIGTFDVIFIRNILIYFDAGTRDQIIRRVLEVLRPGGYLFVSHTENLRGFAERLRQVKPSIYLKS